MRRRPGAAPRESTTQHAQRPPSQCRSAEVCSEGLHRASRKRSQPNTEVFLPDCRGAIANTSVRIVLSTRDMNTTLRRGDSRRLAVGRRSEADFLGRFPEYAETAFLDDVRAREFRRLDDTQEIYLDYVGAHLYPHSLVQSHAEELCGAVYGNPHSSSPAATRASASCEDARSAVKTFFHDTADEYVVVFCANATAALKLVGESYPFQRNGELLLTADNHNSVNGIREFARQKGCAFNYSPVHPDSMRLAREDVVQRLERPAAGGPRLFVFPAQSNFSGIRHDLRLVEVAQQAGWQVLLDAAAFAPTGRLDLAVVRPDFVVASFYKMFGYPTGVGCVLAKRAALNGLCRPWFSGGTVEVASVGGDGHVLSSAEAGFEDGTVNFLSLSAVRRGLQFLERLGMSKIHARVSALTSWTLEHMLSLRHTSGRSLVRVYGSEDARDRGATIAFNLSDPAGKPWFYDEVEREAAASKISLRGGCFCNPGAAEAAFGISPETVRALFEQQKPVSYDVFVALLRTQGVAGALRVSFGYPSNFADAESLLDFIASYVDRPNGRSRSCDQFATPLGTRTKED